MPRTRYCDDQRDRAFSSVGIRIGAVFLYGERVIPYRSITGAFKMKI